MMNFESWYFLFMTWIMHDLFRGDDKRFYHNNVQLNVQRIEHAVELINREYNSAARQSRAKNFLYTLTLRNQIDEHSAEGQALEKVYKTITKLALQVSMSHRGDAHKIAILGNVVAEHKSATEPIIRIATHQLTFQQLYGELEAAYQLDKEAQLAVFRDKPGREAAAYEEESKIAGVLFHGQGL